uniref:Uncharacterized protein n=1 Tax=Trichobilharzia regenti TaxID=157069 RepID=A0AA85JTA9_TRIRE|nr:unnamed protein product [Trichobilharzia regenti]
MTGGNSIVIPLDRCFEVRFNGPLSKVGNDFRESLNEQIPVRIGLNGTQGASINRCCVNCPQVATKQSV